LVLYWVVNNILSIAQQWQINKMIIKRAIWYCIQYHYVSNGACI
jgi:membrane protein insertase Oxa1/YidC/SpoIIIJ